MVAVAAWSVGLNTVFFALDKVSPIGSRPILVAVGLLLTVALTWLLTLPRRRHLPAPVARRVLMQSLGVAVFTGAATYFVFMQIVMPLLFVTGVSMGRFFK